MDVIKKLAAGAPGTKRYVREYGEQLLCVRYRRDIAGTRRLTTVELIVDEAPLAPPQNAVEKKLFPHPNGNVVVRVGYHEQALRQRVKEAGAKWLPDRKLWQLPRRKAVEMRIEKRIVTE
jgi:hypothetical protein